MYIVAVPVVNWAACKAAKSSLLGTVCFLSWQQPPNEGDGFQSAPMQHYNAPPNSSQPRLFALRSSAGICGYDMS